MPTLQDVARKAGVSTATVSKVLSNTPYFTEETRQKVLRAVEEVGYVPNLAARALSSGKSHIVAVVFPYVYDPIFKDPMVMSILEGVEAECTGQGYNLLLSTPRLSETGPDDNFRQLIQSGYIDGVISIDSVPVASTAKAALDKDIPAVVIGYHAASSSVHGDDRNGGRLLMQHLIELGHRDIGIITVHENMNLALNERMVGLQMAAQDAGLDFARMPIAHGDFSVASGEVALTALLEASPNLSAIIALNDRMAMGAIRQAHKLGRCVPADLSVVGYDDIPSAELYSPPLTTINQKGPEMGQTAARLLFEVLNGHKPTPVTLPVELVIRSSSAIRP